MEKSFATSVLSSASPKQQGGCSDNHTCPKIVWQKDVYMLAGVMVQKLRACFVVNNPLN